MAGFFLVVVLAILCQFNVKSEDKCIRLSAAFSYDEQVYLVHGNNFVALDADLTESYNGTLNDEFGLKGLVQAAAVYADDDTLYFFEGNKYFYYYWGSSWGPDDNSDWSKFFEGGIDAAASIGDKSYFFKECKYVEDVHGERKKGQNVELGLPCDLDSAWGIGDEMYITKGDQYWVMSAEGTVDGPRDLTSLVTLTSTSICQEKENPYVAKIRAEQKYEEENGCAIIDAAITWEDKVYLFNNDEYIRLNESNVEDRIRSIHNWGGQPANIDAGIVWEPNQVTYFFKGPSYYRYAWLYLGPIGNELWGPFFEEGIDAAGNFNDQSYFFKGCHVSIYWGTKEDESVEVDAQGLGFPCHPDAAFSRDGSLHVIKRNQVWSLHSGTEVATGPAPLSTVAVMTSWEACAPEDES